MYNNLQKYFSSFVFLIKVLIVSGAYYIISDRLIHNAMSSGSLWNNKLQNPGLEGLSIVTVLLFLSVVNWLLEIAKWRSLTSSVASVSFMSAARQSLASLTASLLTPNRIGEYGAKAIYFRKALRTKVLALNFFGNSLQMLVTVIFGLLGLFSLRHAFSLPEKTTFVIAGVATLAISLILLAYLGSRRNRRLKIALSELKAIPIQLLTRGFLFSVARYMVFAHQFYLFLVFFEVDLGYATAMSLIASMYFISSVIPGFVLFDWLVKGSVAVTLFGLTGVEEWIVLNITSAMWLLNFAVPAVIGSYYVLTFNSRTLKLSKNKIIR